ncbi:hypothetical protein ASPWEDRAFT_421653 [Aspergillus wentii DTO 134E9]|uniref:Uncharacterized protein n=1 Tax=Aspergillus wentii DTO 134E9 TaxID=1073089 RepID=A0A1L9RP92_ASPWE|nr:uncharacterized protein ASPWEDRAFT_421653 [Aspergillus wentii DTO 134E9]OJJ36744.1 hypothetical protein ASPWEDRAFT_421653 [Aspergillus wentii DTO 134E9]
MFVSSFHQNPVTLAAFRSTFSWRYFNKKLLVWTILLPLGSRGRNTPVMPRDWWMISLENGCVDSSSAKTGNIFLGARLDGGWLLILRLRCGGGGNEMAPVVSHGLVIHICTIKHHYNPQCSWTHGKLRYPGMHISSNRF